MSASAKHRVKSTWTPLSNEDSNSKIFEERRLLVGKWFDKWTNQQRKRVLEDILEKCKLRQLEFVGGIVKERVPVYSDDFTRILPRVISLYIFSYLDPRSLCRSAKVCWFWRYLTELDEIWMPKCLRLGWFIGFSPSPFEHGIWKRHYIENLKSLRYMKPQATVYDCGLDRTSDFWKPVDDYAEESVSESILPPEETEVETVASQLDGASLHESPRQEGTSVDPTKPTSLGHRKNSPAIKKPSPWKGSDKPPPWRGSDPVPKDTWRYNYLQNEDEVEKIARLRKKGVHGLEAEEIAQNAKSKVKAGNNKLNTIRVRSRSLPRNQTPSEHLDNVSVTDVSQPNGRPEWAQAKQGAPFVATMKPSASERPAPVRPPSIVKSTRTERDLPSTELFPKSPWNIPQADDNDSDD